MRRLFPKVGLVGILVVAITFFFCFTVLAAEKKKFVYTTKGEKATSVINLHDSNDLRNKITQWSRSAIIIEHSDPSLVGSEQIIHGQSNYSAYMDKDTRGFSRGYTIGKSKDGDCFYSKWESIWSVTTLGAGAWESNEEVKFQIFGGTGKYSNAKGGGSCQSKTTFRGVTTKCEGEWEY